MIQKSVILNFPSEVVDKPILSSMIKKFDLEVNIIQAYVAPDEDGKMFTIMKGSESAVEGAFSYLKDLGVRMIFPTKNLVRDEQKCVHCGACVGQCSPRAFTVDQDSQHILFDTERCIACDLCIPSCCYGAIESISEHLRKKGEL